MSAKTTTRKPRPKSKLSIEKDFENCDEFDIIESDPDSVTSDSSEESAPEDEVLNKRKKFQNQKPPSLSPEEKSVNAFKKERIIEQTHVGFKEYCSALDWRMLGYFFKSLLGFFACGLILGLIHLVITFAFNEDLWYEYFPIDDDSNIIQGGGSKQEL